jgi:putative pyruvate formate lyase activating enzyme
MVPSRRKFVQCLAAAACGVGLAGCNKSAGPNLTVSSSTSEKSMAYEPIYLQTERTGKLKKIETELWNILESCRLCPRKCGVNRLKGEKGFCSSADKLKVHTAHLHFGEEKPLVGKGGSGTVFFSNCNLLCCFCQNWEINHRGDGNYITHDQLAFMMLELQKRGAHNINLVTPTHIVPHIVKALRIASSRGLRLPLVYNTSAYDNIEVIKMLDGIVDIYLPDFKYQDGALAGKYSSGAMGYHSVAAEVIKEMHRQVGILQVDASGVARRGLIIRHLVMPDNIAGTDRFVQWVARELSTDTYVNIMEQYHPEHKAFDYPEISRRITNGEYRQAIQWAKAASLTNLD